ncbi:hypothetical protein CcarbDRAFT_1140 [Clostridium carboxidivorans P7]|uniref:Uncharacterized protein n=1 Tax=Clostridium carboxidivorans P7 TaxID=536227 RepID=C6PQS3_9CLOT|nr:hypothetical protein CcarbDRAFT_1140 [Clostridium carboxidivorans P7]
MKKIICVLFIIFIMCFNVQAAENNNYTESLKNTKSK